jgi:multiple sugar transport system permease protein
VTLPLLRPSLQVALILRTILAFQVFAVVVALAGRQFSVLAYETYRWYTDLRNPSVAAAYALLIMLFSIVNTAIYLRALRVSDEQASML